MEYGKAHSRLLRKDVLCRLGGHLAHGVAGDNPQALLPFHNLGGDEVHQPPAENAGGAGVVSGDLLYPAADGNSDKIDLPS